MNLERSAYRFMLDYGHIQNIEEQCRQYTINEQQQQDNCRKVVMTVYKITLLMDVIQMCNEHVELGDLILHRPSNGWQIFHHVVYKIIQEMQWLPQHVISPTQLLLVLRLETIPDLPGYTIQHLADFPKITEEPRFFVYTGVVCGITMNEKYTESACFHCLNSSCLTRKTGDKYIRMHVTGYTESMTVRGDLTCSQCGSHLSEDIAFRILSEKLLIEMVPVQSLMSCEQDKPIRYQSITVVLRGDLCNMVQLGDEYTVIGIPVYEVVTVDGKTTINTILEANNIFPCNSNTPSITRTITHTHSNSIMDIHDACRYSPWTFTATLAYSFAAQLYPPGIYQRLKLILLLSIVAAKTERRKANLLNLLVVGKEFHHGMKLLQYGASFLSRRITHGIGMDITGSTNRKDWIDAGSVPLALAGSLPLASGGVCIIRNIGNWKNETKEKLQKVLESRTVVIKSRQLDVKHNHTLAATIWTICDSHSVTHNASTEIENIPRHLLDHLGLVTVIDPPTQDNDVLVQNILADHILQTAMRQFTIPPLIRQDYKQLLDICSSLDVSLSPMANSLLKGYYLASRRARGHIATNIPKTAMDILVPMTIAHARLSLRNEALEEDAVIAIMLYEEGLLYRTGHSNILVQQTPHVKSEDISEYIGKKFDCKMRDLHKTIYGFIKNYTTVDNEVMMSSLQHLPEE